MTRSERIDDLVDRAIWDHAGDPGREFCQWELTAGAVTAALLEEEEQPPMDVLRRVRADALAFFAREGGATPGKLPWARLLAAAVVLLTISTAFSLWWASPAPPPPASERMAALVGLDSDDLIRVDWQPGPSELRGDVRGEIVWSDAGQEGYMRFVGLPANDPTDKQYQLWIFDALRSDAHPVDGGVFDIISTSDELVVAIRAKIRVHDASMFAITVEEPGGVVVSDREHIVAVASL